MKQTGGTRDGSRDPRVERTPVVSFGQEDRPTTRSTVPSLRFPWLRIESGTGSKDDPSTLPRPDFGTQPLLENLG